MLNRRQLGWAMAATVCGPGATFAAGGAEPPLEIALFRDATEIAFTLADQRHARDATAPTPPRRRFVANADEAHQFVLDGPYPVVGMSLDDVLDCAVGGHIHAGELRILSGVHRGFLQLMAAPGITGVAALRGRRVAVDTDTGYARALYEILRRAGLDPHRDVEIVYAGATNLRYEKLLAHAFDATLLGAPFTRLALDRGYTALTSVIGALGGYQAVVLVGRQPWLDAHAEAAQALTRGLFEAIALGADPAAQATVVRVVRHALPSATPDQTSAIANDLFGPPSEFLKDGQMRPADVQVVLDLFNAERGTRLTQDHVQRMIWRP